MKRQIWKYSLKREKILEIRDDDRVLGPESLAALARSLNLHQEEQEHLITIALTTRNQIRGYYTVSIGLADRTQIHAREVFRQAIVLGAVRIALVHNHPSGDPTPSQGDVRATRELTEASKIIGIELVDHVIVGDADQAQRGYASLRELGYL